MATATTAASSGPVVKTATATLEGSAQTILTDAQGKTLYYFTPDKGTGKATCTGSCAAKWPALTFSGSGKPTGTLGTVQAPNGWQQVTYNGWPLYTYTGDSAPGLTNGQNIGGKWFVVTPDFATGA